MIGRAPSTANESWRNAPLGEPKQHKGFHHYNNIRTSGSAHTRSTSKKVLLVDYYYYFKHNITPNLTSRSSPSQPQWQRVDGTFTCTTSGFETQNLFEGPWSQKRTSETSGYKDLICV
jgi:hypothetical protein